MSTAQLATTLTRLRNEAASHAPEDWSDVELLRAYARANDQGAFAALVRRHGPVVFGVCRRVLQDAHAAEDAFQAVFLTLARKAATLRDGRALSCWLHGVSYRVAMRAKRSTTRRRQHESRVAPRNSPPAWEVGWRELQDILDEEVQQLPTTYRAAFVLCCLEGLSKAEAAERLGLKENTVSSRLARARKRLQQRLARRGISLSAVLAALAVSCAGRAAVPPRLVRIATTASSRLGAGAPVTGLSARAISLAEGVTTMFSLKTQLALLLLLLCALGAGVRLLARPAAEPLADPPATPMTPAKEKAQGASTFAGRVLDPAGKPCAGAKLHLLYYTPRVLPLPVRTTSGTDGSFRFTIARKEFDQSSSVRPWDEAIVVATAPGYGIGLPTFRPGQRPNVEALTLQLAKDDVPITGRILDLEGKPVAGVAVGVHSLHWPTRGDLTAWLRDLREKKEGYTAIRAHLMGLEGMWMGRDIGRLFPPAVTGADGRFRLTGVGRERVVGLRLVGPAVVATEVWAMTRPGGMIRTASWRRGSDDGEMTFYGSTFERVMEPCRPILGVVRDKDTGKPLPGAVVESYVFPHVPISGRTWLRTVADKEGRYRLLGMPKGRGCVIRVAGPEGQPYLMALANVPDAPGLNPVTVDVRLKRGVWATGKVTDKATGKPVHSTIRYAVFPDNPFRKEAPGLTFDDYMQTRAQDGSFRFVALPGRGVVTARAWQQKYLTDVGADRIKGRESLFLQPFHTAVVIDPARDADTVRCDIVLDPGLTLRGTVIDAERRPLTGVRVAGLNGNGDWEYFPLPAAAFTVRALRPGETRLLQFSHPEKRLAGSLVVRGDTRGPVTVRLVPAGTLTGRFVTPDGDPLADLELIALQGPPVADPRVPVKFDPTIGTIPRNLRTDKDGKFRIEGLAPGLTYRLGLRKKFYLLQPEGPASAVTVEAGKTKDLGKVTIKPME